MSFLRVEAGYSLNDKKLNEDTIKRLHVRDGITRIIQKVKK
jgi:hypothetical protein